MRMLWTILLTIFLVLMFVRAYSDAGRVLDIEIGYVCGVVLMLKLTSK